MPEYTPSEVKDISRICQVLSINDRGSFNALRGSVVDQRLPEMIYLERLALESMMILTPSASYLQGVANYVYALCYPYVPRALQIISARSGTAPVITGPSNQSVNVGDTATFSVSVSGTGPFAYQWYVGGILIPGATSASYPKTSAQLSDSGGQYTVQVTNATGMTTSNPGVLTVTASLTAQWGYFDVDPYPNLVLGIDNLTYQINETIVSGNQIVITYPLASTNNKFDVLRFPMTEADMTIWNNTTSNFGTIPDATMRETFVANSYKYVVSRTAISLDATATTLTYSRT